VHVQGLLDLVREELGLLLLLKELFLKDEDLATEVRDTGCLVLGDD
jgi:hypothetical protein